MFEREKKLAEAESELKVLTQNQPKDWRGWKSLGYFYVRTDKPNDAIASFGKYVTLRPDTSDSHDSLAEGFLKKKDPDQAIENLKKSLSIDEKFAPSLMKLGRAHEMKQQNKEARDAYQRLLALETNPNLRKEAEKKLKELK